MLGTQAQPPPHPTTGSSTLGSTSGYLHPSHQPFTQNALVSRPTRRKREADDDDLEDVEDRKRALVDSVGSSSGGGGGGGHNGRDGDGDVTMDL